MSRPPILWAWWRPSRWGNAGARVWSKALDCGSAIGRSKPAAECYDAAMASRAADWLRQAGRDLEHARHAAADGDHEWACFAAQQAAEKAVKALHQRAHQEAWGHVVHQLLASLPQGLAVPPALVDAGRRLDRHYIPARYPNGFAAGVPGDFYTHDDAAQAVGDAEAIFAFCTRHLA